MLPTCLGTTGTSPGGTRLSPPAPLPHPGEEWTSQTSGAALWPTSARRVWRGWSQRASTGAAHSWTLLWVPPGEVHPKGPWLLLPSTPDRRPRRWPHLTGPSYHRAACDAGPHSQLAGSSACLAGASSAAAGQVAVVILGAVVHTDRDSIIVLVKGWCAPHLSSSSSSSSHVLALTVTAPALREPLR